MMKYLFISGLMLIGYVAKSQVIISLLLGDKLNSGKMEFGLAGGFNWSAIKNLQGAESLRGFNLGFYFDIKMKDPAWMLNTGVIVKSPMGADELPLYSLNDRALDSAFAGGKITRKLRYFNVPVMMKYNFRNHLFVKGGIQLGLRSKCFDRFTKSVNDKDDLQHTIKIGDQYHPIDAGLAFGLGYRLMKGNGMNIELQYYHGVIDISLDDSTPGWFNRSLYLTAGIPIGKKSKKAEEDQTLNAHMH